MRQPNDVRDPNYRAKQRAARARRSRLVYNSANGPAKRYTDAHGRCAYKPQ